MLFRSIGAVAALALTAYGYKHARYLFDLQNFRNNFIQNRSATYCSGIPYVGNSIKDKAIAKATHEVDGIINSLLGWSIPDAQNEMEKRWILPLGLAGDEMKFLAKKTSQGSLWMWHGINSLWKKG